MLSPRCHWADVMIEVLRLALTWISVVGSVYYLGLYAVVNNHVSKLLLPNFNSNG